MEDDVMQSGTDRYAVSQAYRWKAERDKARQELERGAQDAENRRVELCAMLDVDPGTGWSDAIECMRRRLMPEGMEWPRYDTGGLVSIGDDVVGPDYGERIHVDEITFHANGFTLREKTGLDHWYESDDRFERTVLAADGKPLLNGDEVWKVKGGGGPYHVQEVRDGVSVCVGETHCEFKPSQLTHRAPVIAADGEPLEVGQTVWDTNGDELVIGALEDGGHTVTCRYADVGDSIPTHGMWSPSDLTHQRPVLDADGVPIKVGDHGWWVEQPGVEIVVKHIDPDECGQLTVCDVHGRGNTIGADEFTHTKPEHSDSWERIEQDAGCTATKYNERRGTIFTTKQQVARDLVRRCRALAERERDE